MTSQPTLSEQVQSQYFDIEIVAAPTVEVEMEDLPNVTRFTTESDIRLLAMTCTAEAETESRLGRELVMATLINRAEQNNSTLLRELQRPRQWPWWGRVRRISESCEELAREYVLDHIHRNVTHFHHRRIRPVWARRNAVQHVEGAHIFYNLN